MAILIICLSIACIIGLFAGANHYSKQPHKSMKWLLCGYGLLLSEFVIGLIMVVIEADYPYLLSVNEEAIITCLGGCIITGMLLAVVELSERRRRLYSFEKDAELAILLGFLDSNTDKNFTDDELEKSWFACADDDMDLDEIVSRYGINEGNADEVIHNYVHNLIIAKHKLTDEAETYEAKIRKVFEKHMSEPQVKCPDGKRKPLWCVGVVLIALLLAIGAFTYYLTSDSSIRLSEWAHGRQFEQFEKLCLATFEVVGNDNNAGMCYENGYGVVPDDYEAFTRYRKSADEDNAEGLMNLGRCYAEGIGTECDIDKSISCFEKAAKMGNSEGMRRYASFYSDTDYKKAFEWYKKSADLGDTRAMVETALLYLEGVEGASDRKSAAEYALEAAKKGDTQAMKLLAHIYERDENYDMTYYWYLESAKRGDAMAMADVAECYKEGKGVEQSDEKTFEWYKKAAEAGDDFSMYLLGRCYLSGTGTEYNRELAKYWMKEALFYLPRNERLHEEYEYLFPEDFEEAVW